MTEIEYSTLYAAEYDKVLNNVKKILIRGRPREDHEYYLQDAEECAQEAFMALWKKKDILTGNPKDYLYRVSKNQALKLRELSQSYDQWGMPINFDKTASV